MNKTILIVLGGAVLAAILVAVLVQVTLGGKKPSEPVGKGVQVLVAAKDLKKGRELEEGDMVWKKWSESALFNGAIVRKEDQKPEDALKGRIERSFAKGEALVKRAIIKESKKNYVVARLKPGERAISIKVKAEDMVAGFIVPGSFVDVILTYKHRVVVDKEEPPQIRDMVSMNIDKYATETVLENIRVLAIDQKADRKSDDKIKPGKTVTLATTAREAEILSLAGEMGTLTLALRGVGDDMKNENLEAITDARLTKIDDEIHAEFQKLKKDSGVTTNTVKIYSGSQVETIPVR